MEGNRKIVKSYNGVWHIARTFYNIGGLALPTPMTINFILYFLIATVIMFFIGGILPGLVRYLLVPGVFAWVFDQKLIDGKNPFQFVRSIVTHYYIVLFLGSKVSRFKYHKYEKPAFDSEISFRTHEALKQ